MGHWVIGSTVGGAETAGKGKDGVLARNTGGRDDQVCVEDVDRRSSMDETIVNRVVANRNGSTRRRTPEHTVLVHMNGERTSYPDGSGERVDLNINGERKREMAACFVIVVVVDTTIAAIRVERFPKQLEVKVRGPETDGLDGKSIVPAHPTRREKRELAQLVAGIERRDVHAEDLVEDKRLSRSRHKTKDGARVSLECDLDTDASVPEIPERVDRDKERAVEVREPRLVQSVKHTHVLAVHVLLQDLCPGSQAIHKRIIVPLDKILPLLARQLVERHGERIGIRDPRIPPIQHPHPAPRNTQERRVVRHQDLGRGGVASRGVGQDRDVRVRLCPFPQDRMFGPC